RSGRQEGPLPGTIDLRGAIRAAILARRAAILARRGGILARRSDAALTGRINRSRTAAGVAAATVVEPVVLLLQHPLIGDLVMEQAAHLLQATAPVVLPTAAAGLATGPVVPLRAGNDALGRRQSTGRTVIIMMA